MNRFPEAAFRLSWRRHGVALANPRSILSSPLPAARGGSSSSRTGIAPHPTTSAWPRSRISRSAACRSHGSPARSFGAVVGGLHLLTFVLPGAVLRSGASCIEESMATPEGARRDRSPGPRSQYRVPRRGPAIGCAVREAPFPKVALNPFVVRNVSTLWPLRALARQARWGQVRFASRSSHAFSRVPCLNPSRSHSRLRRSRALLASPRAPPHRGPPAGVLLLLRVAPGFALARRDGADHSAGQPSSSP